MTLTLWRHRLVALAPFIGVAALIVATPSDDGPTVCPFALCTGMACPGCGMTRAASHLVRGNFDLAFAYHPLVPIVAVQLIGGWIWYMLRQRGRVGPPTNRMLTIMFAITAAALIAVWVLRVASGTLPPV